MGDGNWEPGWAGSKLGDLGVPNTLTPRLPPTLVPRPRLRVNIDRPLKVAQLN